jgi:hypothetical protein
MVSCAVLPGTLGVILLLVGTFWGRKALGG